LNPVLENTPEAINKDPYGDGWMIKIRLTDPSEIETLLTAEKYKELL
jgi:glycine cleavage system H protein